MNIAVDAFPLAVRASGISNYTKNILLNLLNIDTGNKYFLYALKDFDFPMGIKRVAISGRNVPSYGNTIWLFTKGVWLMKKDDIDIFWGTRQMLPPYLPKGIKKILTIYDLVWHYFPETMDRYNLLVQKALFGRSVRSADHIIVISKATKDSLIGVMKVPEDKITIAYPASDGFIPLDKESSSEYISKKYGASRNYILTVSTVEPRKNLITLLRAFSEVRDLGYQLLIAGASGWKTSNIFKEYESLDFTEKEVKFLGFVSNEDMNKLYSGAEVFVFPSIYEGFGIPPLEAMASGTPVIASNSSSIPEVVGSAGVLLDPLNVDEWAVAIKNLLGDRQMRKHLIDEGLKQAGNFSWLESAKKTLEVFKKK